MENQITIIGGGLAGCEAAWQAAQAGIHVNLYEMRPLVQTGAHKTSDLAELICSNSLGSNLPDRATGLLLQELRSMGSLLIQVADQVKVPAGGALAVDRDLFAKTITEKISSHPNITVLREEVVSISDQPTLVASGPLSSQNILDSIQTVIGSDSLYFYDAIAPIIVRDSINFDIAFKASRYDRGSDEGGDYINCPLNQEQYQTFIHELIHAKRIDLHEFEKSIDEGVKAGSSVFFERCLPIEIMASRGEMAMAYGPMRPVGITDPRTGRWPKAVVQLRQDNLIDSLYNMVGFQTNLTFPEQKRIFQMIPGLETAEFIRYGQMHRNTYLNAPGSYNSSLQHRYSPKFIFCWTGHRCGRVCRQYCLRFTGGQEYCSSYSKSTVICFTCHNHDWRDSALHHSGRSRSISTYESKFWFTPGSNPSSQACEKGQVQPYG